MSFRDIEVKPEYRSRLDNVIRDFYTPVLKEAVMYKRAVGYFSSSALLSMSAGICGLIENGGSIQLIASPHQIINSFYGVYTVIINAYRNIAAVKEFLIGGEMSLILSLLFQQLILLQTRMLQILLFTCVRLMAEIRDCVRPCCHNLRTVIFRLLQV